MSVERVILAEIENLSEWDEGWVRVKYSLTVSGKFL